MLQTFLKDTWNFFKIHYIALAAIILPIVIPINIVITAYQHLIGDTQIGIWHMVLPATLKMVAEPLYSVGLIFYISQAVKGELIDTKTAWLLGVKFWVPFLILSVFLSIIIMSGLVMLIIPGVIFMVRFSFAEFELLLNNHKPIEAMKNSWHLTGQYAFIIFMGFAFIGLILFMPYLLFMSYFSVEKSWFLVLDMVMDIVYSLLGVLFTIFAFRIYDHASKEKNKSFELKAT